MGGLSACLPASSSSLLNSWNRQGSFQLQREEKAGQAVPALGCGGDPRRGVRTRERGRERREPDESQTRQESAHTQTRPGTHTPTLTYSHTLCQVSSCRPPCRDTQTPSTHLANSQNTSLDTQGEPDPALPPQPTESVWAPDSSRRVEGSQEEKTAGVS